MDHIRNQKFSDTTKPSADFAEFIGLAGLGKAETSSLTWADVDIERGRFTTFRHKIRKGFTIPIYSQVRLLLERLRRKSASSYGRMFFKDAKKAIAGAYKRLGLPAYYVATGICLKQSAAATFVTSLYTFVPMAANVAYLSVHSTRQSARRNAVGEAELTEARALD